MSVWNDATHEYKFDVSLLATLAVTAASEDEARRLVVLHMENLPTDLYLRPHVKLVAIELDDEEPVLTMVDGNGVTILDAVEPKPENWIAEAERTLDEAKERHGTAR